PVAARAATGADAGGVAGVGIVNIGACDGAGLSGVGVTDVDFAGSPGNAALIVVECRATAGSVIAGVDILDCSLPADDAGAGHVIVGAARWRRPLVPRPCVVSGGSRADARPRSVRVINVSGSSRPAIRAPRGHAAIGIIISAIAPAVIWPPIRSGRAVTPII